MNVAKKFLGFKRAAVLWMGLGIAMVSGCVEINGQAEVSDKGRVKVVTLYDFSKVFRNIKDVNPALSQQMEGFDCKIFVSNSPNFKCSDEGPLKFKISDEQDKPEGLTYNEATQELSMDVVKYFAKVTTLQNMMNNSNGQDSLISAEVPPLLPLKSAFRDRYAKEGLSIVLKVQFANEIVSIDGQEVKGKGRDMTINFMDIMDKPSYVVVTRAKAPFSGAWIFTLLVLILLGAAVWYLWRQRKQKGVPPSAPSTPVAPVPTSGAASDVAVMDEIEANAAPAKPATEQETGGGAVAGSKSERFAQAMSAAAVGVGSAGVGASAQHPADTVRDSALVDETSRLREPPVDYAGTGEDDIPQT